MESIICLDRVFVFGDKLSFLIPHGWIEQTSDNDHYFIGGLKPIPAGLEFPH